MPCVETNAMDSEEHPALRIGDAERDEVMETLTEHHVRGRLPVEELDRRHRVALTAETDAELASLLVDLPTSPARRSHLAVAGDWWDLEPRVRAARMARWAASPVALVAGGVLVASVNIQTDEAGFAAGLSAASLGYFAHLLIARWSKKLR
jgi:hypothetical protein